MTARPSDADVRLPGWRSLLVLAAIYSVIVTAIAVARSDSSSDFRDFWETAAAFRETGLIRDDLGVHNYLPFFTIFMAPWSLVPLPPAVAAFTLLSLALFSATVLMGEVLFRGGPQAVPARATWVTLVLMLPYVTSSAVLGQVNLLVLFLVVAAWLLVERGREWTAGVPLALAILIKILPAALLPFLLFTRRWRTALAAAATATVLGAGLPLLSLGWDETVRQHQAYYRRAVLEHSAGATISSDKPRKARFTNQSLPIVLRRVLSSVNADPDEATPPLFVNAADLSRTAILGTYGVILSAMAGWSVFATLRTRVSTRLRGEPLTDPARADADRRALSLWLCFMLVAAPLLWTHYLVFVYWTVAYLAHRAEDFHRRAAQPDRASLVGLAAWAIAALLLAWPAARAWGAQLAGVLALWVAVVWPRAAGRHAR